MKKTRLNEWLIFFGKTLFYLVILLGLLYLYQFAHVSGGHFIYNQF